MQSCLALLLRPAMMMFMLIELGPRITSHRGLSSLLLFQGKPRGDLNKQMTLSLCAPVSVCVCVCIWIGLGWAEQLQFLAPSRGQEISKSTLKSMISLEAHKMEIFCSCLISLWMGCPSSMFSFYRKDKNKSLQAKLHTYTFPCLYIKE